ncbi:MAG TPA: hypothetical protein VIW69_14735 [Candidatus Elarobacter sp.]
MNVIAAIFVTVVLGLLEFTGILSPIFGPGLPQQSSPSLGSLLATWQPGPVASKAQAGSRLAFPSDPGSLYPTWIGVVHDDCDASQPPVPHVGSFAHGSAFLLNRGDRLPLCDAVEAEDDDVVCAPSGTDDDACIPGPHAERHSASVAPTNANLSAFMMMLLSI